MPISTNFWIMGRSRTLGNFLVKGSTDTSTYVSSIVGSVSALQLDRSTDLGNPHQRHCHVPHVRGLLHELHAQTCSSHESFDDSVDRDGDPKPIEGTDEELKHKMDVMEPELLLLTGESLIGKRNLVVLHHSTCENSTP